MLEEARAAGIKKVISRKPYPKTAALDGFATIRVSDAQGGRGTAAWVTVTGAREMQKALEASNQGHDFVVVECQNWMIIPLENLIADFRRNGKKIYAYMKEKSEMQLAFSILEKGVDGMVIPAASLAVAREVIPTLGGGSQLAIRSAKVTKVLDVGNGERVCIDTASQLDVGEGLLIGSRANFFFLVHSETIPSEYIPTREFRVNAGAIHSYVLGEDGKTRYLSELKASDKVRTVRNDGGSRAGRGGEGEDREETSDDDRGGGRRGERDRHAPKGGDHQADAAGRQSGLRHRAEGGRRGPGSHEQEQSQTLRRRGRRVHP